MKGLSTDAELLLRWLASRGGEGPVDIVQEGAAELVRAGLGTVVASGGVTESTMFLSPAGKKLASVSFVRPPSVGRSRRKPL